MTDLPRPRPRQGELLIRVVAAGVNPVDGKIREGWLAEVLPHAFPLVPGWDAAGVVEELGEGATPLPQGRPGLGLRQASRSSSGAVTPSTSRSPERARRADAGASCSTRRPQPSRGRADRHCSASSDEPGHRAGQQRARPRRRRRRGPLRRATGAQRRRRGLGHRRNGQPGVRDGAGSQRRHRLHAGAISPRRRARLCPDGFDLVLDACRRRDPRRQLCPGQARRHGWSASSTSRTQAMGRERGIGVEFLVVEPDARATGDAGRSGRPRSGCAPTCRRSTRWPKAAEAQKTVAEGHVRGKLVLNL